jgi:hypothetical protein
MSRAQLTAALALLLPCSFAFHATAQVSISPPSLKFLSQVVSSTSPSQTVTLSNVGHTTLTVSSVAASGGYSVANHCASVQAGSSCTIDVSFISGLIGTTAGVLTIADSDPSSPQMVDLSGIAVSPLTMSPSSLNFGKVAIGTKSQSKTVTITSNGAAIAIATIAASGDYIQSNNCPATLSAGQSCTISASFAPTSSGTVTGALSVTSTASGFGFAAGLTGTGTGTVVSQVSIRPKTLSFGSIGALDFTKRSKTITLANVSSTTSVTIQSVSVTSPRSSGTDDYQIASNRCQGMLAPGAECQISISLGASQFFPIRSSGTVTIVDSDTTSPQTVGLSATMLPEVSIRPASLTFAPQPVGTTSASQIVTLTNNFDDSGISLLPLSVSGDFIVDGTAGSTPCGLSPGLNPGQSCTLGVSFAPNHTGTINGEVSFTLYPECDPELVIIQHEPCPAAQTIVLKGTGQS